jgi:hypothetical protein
MEHSRASQSVQDVFRCCHWRLTIAGKPGPSFSIHSHQSFYSLREIDREVEIEGSQFEASPGKKLERPYLKNKLGVVADACNSSYLAGGGRRIEVQG